MYMGIKVQTAISKESYQKVIDLMEKYNLSKYGAVKYVMDNFQESENSTIEAIKEELKEKPFLTLESYAKHLRKQVNLTKSSGMYHDKNCFVLLRQLLENKCKTEECVYLLQKQLQLELISKEAISRGVKVKSLGSIGVS